MHAGFDGAFWVGLVFRASLAIAPCDAPRCGQWIKNEATKLRHGPKVAWGLSAKTQGLTELKVRNSIIMTVNW